MYLHRSSHISAFSLFSMSGYDNIRAVYSVFGVFWLTHHIGTGESSQLRLRACSCSSWGARQLDSFLYFTKTIFTYCKFWITWPARTQFSTGSQLLLLDSPKTSSTGSLQIVVGTSVAVWGAPAVHPPFGNAVPTAAPPKLQPPIFSFYNILKEHINHILFIQSHK
jgi:hypothetical protein